MHLEVEDDVRQGLRMMKYLINHNNDFANPFYAFVVAFLQATTGIAAEVFCILFLCSLQDAINIIWRYVAYGFISRIDNIYAESLDTDHKMHGETDPFVVKRNGRDIDKPDSKYKRALANKIGRVIYKTMRILYTSFIFYFLPYLALFIPQLVNLFWS